MASSRLTTTSPPKGHHIHYKDNAFSQKSCLYCNNNEYKWHFCYLVQIHQLFINTKNG